MATVRRRAHVRRTKKGGAITVRQHSYTWNLPSKKPPKTEAERKERLTALKKLEERWEDLTWPVGPSGSMPERTRKKRDDELRQLFHVIEVEKRLLRPTEEIKEEQIEEKRKEAESLLRAAKELRRLAALGMHPRSYPKKAQEWEDDAAAILKKIKVKPSKKEQDA